MKNEKPVDYITFFLCHGLAEYDANEIMSESGESCDKNNCNRYCGINEGGHCEGDAAGPI